MPWVLDASAALAVLLDEPFTDTMYRALEEGSLVSAANLAEVISRLDQVGMPYSVDAIYSRLNTSVVPLLEEQAVIVGHVRGATEPWGLGLADRACLVTAAAFGATALTTDRAWLELPSPWRERVECVRPD